MTALSRWLPEGMSEEPSELVLAWLEGFVFGADVIPGVIDALRRVPEEVYRACTPMEPPKDRERVSDPVELLAAFGLAAHLNSASQELEIVGLTGDWAPPVIVYCFRALTPLVESQGQVRLVLQEPKPWADPLYGLAVVRGHLQVSTDIDVVYDF